MDSIRILRSHAITTAVLSSGGQSSSSHRGAQIQSKSNLYGICGGQSGAEADVSQSNWILLCQLLSQCFIFMHHQELVEWTHLGPRS
jgi:hypothetical protein